MVEVTREVKQIIEVTPTPLSGESDSQSNPGESIIAIGFLALILIGGIWAIGYVILEVIKFHRNRSRFR